MVNRGLIHNSRLAPDGDTIIINFFGGTVENELNDELQHCPAMDRKVAVYCRG